MLTIARSLEEAAAATGEFLAGGTDVQARRRAGISDGPLVDISRLPGLDVVTWDDYDAAAVGALVTLKTLALNLRLQAAYPALTTTAAGLATPEIRTVATLGGSLLQRTRCSYFRQPHIDCFKKGGAACPARVGHHRQGVIFDRGPCIQPHPSSMGMALLAYEARFEVFGRGELGGAELFGDGADPTRDHTLAPGELLTRVLLPPPIPAERGVYFRAISRAEAEWPIVEAVVRLVVEKDAIRFARVAVGGVAPVPLRLPHVEEALTGNVPTGETLSRAAVLATDGVDPLPQTGYKVEFLQRAVLETLERALG